MEKSFAQEGKMIEQPVILPLLSVVVPVYNCEPYLTCCLDSILNQTYSNLEVILVDDGAKGTEPQICDRYAEQDSRVIVIHKQNAGALAARKTGIKKASGELITFVDSDDYMDPDYYFQMMAYMLDGTVDLISVAHMSDFGGSESIRTQNVPNGIYEDAEFQNVLQNMNCFHAHYYSEGIFPSNWSKIFRTVRVQCIASALPDDIRLGDDAALTFAYLLQSKKIAVDNRICGYHYRTVESSLSRKKDEAYFKSCSELYRFLKPYYDSCGRQEIMNQLEYYRAFMIDFGMASWMKRVSLTTIWNDYQTLKKILLESAVFSHLDVLLRLQLPGELQKSLQLLTKHQTLKYVMIWLKYALRNRRIKAGD